MCISLYSALGTLNLCIKHKLFCVQLPYSKKTYELVKLLNKLGYFYTYKFNKQIITIYLKHYNNNKLLSGFYFYSKPGHLYTISINQLRRDFYKKNKLLILSTVDGICTSYEALKRHQGGIILAEINK